jgi:hypothetical protein
MAPLTTQQHDTSCSSYCTHLGQNPITQWIGGHVTENGKAVLVHTTLPYSETSVAPVTLNPSTK